MVVEGNKRRLFNDFISRQIDMVVEGNIRRLLNDIISRQPSNKRWSMKGLGIVGYTVTLYLC